MATDNPYGPAWAELKFTRSERDQLAERVTELLAERDQLQVILAAIHERSESWYLHLLPAEWIAVLWECFNAAVVNQNEMMFQVLPLRAVFRKAQTVVADWGRSSDSPKMEALAAALAEVERLDALHAAAKEAATEPAVGEGICEQCGRPSLDLDRMPAQIVGSAMLDVGWCPGCMNAYGKGVTARQQTQYPHESGDVIVLGPEVIAQPDGSLINWKGTNYVPAPETGPEEEALEPVWLTASDRTAVAWVISQAWATGEDQWLDLAARFDPSLSTECRNRRSCVAFWR